MKCCIWASAVVAAVCACASAQEDTTFLYQGSLMDNGSPANGTYTISVELWTSVNGGTIGNPIVHNNVQVVDGLFDIPLSWQGGYWFGGERWLSITVNGTQLSPPQQITRAPYAIHARGIRVDQAERVGIGDIGTHNAQLLVLTSDSMGARIQTTSNETEAAAVRGVLDRSSPGSFSAAVRGENRGIGVLGIGVWGSHDGSGWGVYGSSPAGTGVRGHTTGNSGTTYAVYGYSASSSGYDFYAAGPGVNYGSPSSIRWKKNIEPINDPLGMLAQIRGVYFDWDEDHGGQHDMGFIGEEVMEVVPEVVAKEPGTDFVTGMDYGRMTPLLVEAVNALHAKHEMAIAEKDARIDLLARDNAELRARLEALEATVNQLAGSKN
ncbi:MAG: tail fiber domain-containing protein [Phycisphaeraceae bacterium]|nr:tail fiber domain-containing protein [Phycisphaeraceae bacterium]